MWRSLIIGLLATGSGGVRAAAGVPATLTHHGYVTLNGNPVEGQLPFHFGLYDGSSAAVPLWAESLSVDCVGGYYSVVLGLSAPLDPELVAEAGQLTLGMEVDGTALTPRLPLSSVPYALAAATAALAQDVQCSGCIDAPAVAFAFAGSATPGGPAGELECSQACVGAAELENGAVGSAKLSDGAVTPAKLAACGVGQVLEFGGDGWACSVRYPAGSVLQVVHNQNASFIRANPTPIYWDDTVPQSSEGLEITSVSITPRFSSSVLLIEAVVHAVEEVNSSDHITIAVFRNSETDAVAAATEEVYGDYSLYGGLTASINLRQSVPAGGLVPLTFSLRAGLNAPGWININGGAGARRLGGALASGITVTELAP